MSGGLGSRTTTPKWDLILAALDLGLQAWRTTASRDRFIDAVAELGHARVAYDKEHAARVRAEEALRAIAFNAESFHKGEDGKERALKVIAQWASDPASVPEGIGLLADTEQGGKP